MITDVFVYGIASHLIWNHDLPASNIRFRSNGHIISGTEKADSERTTRKENARNKRQIWRRVESEKKLCVQSYVKSMCCEWFHFCSSVFVVVHRGLTKISFSFMEIKSDDTKSEWERERSTGRRLKKHTKKA